MRVWDAGATPLGCEVLTLCCARRYNIEVKDNGELRIVWDHSNSFTVTGVNVRTGSLVHLAVVHERFGDNAGLHVYINGVPHVISAALAPAAPVLPPLFGRDYTPRTRPNFGARLGFAAVYSRPLTQAEVLEAMALPAEQCPTDAEVRGCYRLGVGWADAPDLYLDTDGSGQVNNLLMLGAAYVHVESATSHLCVHGASSSRST